MITVLLVISLLGVLASLAALAWRTLDLEEVRDVISFFGINELGEQLSIGDETLSAFLPSVIPFGMLIFSAISRSVCHSARYRRGRTICAGWCRLVPVLVALLGRFPGNFVGRVAGQRRDVVYLGPVSQFVHWRSV